MINLCDHSGPLQLGHGLERVGHLLEQDELVVDNRHTISLESLSGSV